MKGFHRITFLFAALVMASDVLAQSEEVHPLNKGDGPVAVEANELAPPPKRSKRKLFGYSVASVKEGLSIGLIYAPRPKIKWGDSRQLLLLEGEEEGVTTENKKFKDGLGLSVEYSYFLAQNIFGSAGVDIWQETEGKSNKKASIMPATFHFNVGFFHPSPHNDAFFRAFAGVGLARIGHEYDFVGVNFDESLGFMYQFGIGVSFKNFFFDIVYRNLCADYQEQSDIPTGDDLTSYRKRGEMNLSPAMFRVGIFF